MDSHLGGAVSTLGHVCPDEHVHKLYCVLLHIVRMRRNQIGGKAGFIVVLFFIPCVGVFARNLKLHDLWLSGCPLLVAMIYLL